MTVKNNQLHDRYQILDDKMAKSVPLRTSRTTKRLMRTFGLAALLILGAFIFLNQKHRSGLTFSIFRDHTTLPIIQDVFNGTLGVSRLSTLSRRFWMRH